MKNSIYPNKTQSGYGVNSLVNIFLIGLVCFTGSVSAQTINICANSVIPSGYVIISSQSCTCCGVFQQYTIKNIAGMGMGESIDVCANSPIPSGWVITHSVSCTCCGVFQKITIKNINGMEPGSSLDVCSSSTIPVGWVITNAANCSCCGVFQKLTIKNILCEPIGSIENICSNSTIPSGWIITSDVSCSCCSPFTKRTIQNLSALGTPIVTASNASGCFGTPISLTATPAGGTFSVSNPYFGSSTSYSYTYTNSNGCSAIASANITVKSLPVVTASDVAGCAGASIQLSGTPNGGTFSVLNPYTGPSTTYTYSFTDINGCSNTSLPANITIHPPSTEICNNTDDDCDGQIDEGVKSTFFFDADHDGYGNLSIATLACTAPSGYSALSTDCNDANAAIHPNANEICNNVDDDCDIQIDEGVKLTFYADDDGDGHGNINMIQVACSAPSGYVPDSNDCNDGNAAIHPDAVEICNNLDENCDGLIDNLVATELQLQWQKTVGGSGNDDLARHLRQTSDGGFIIVGESNSNDGDVSGNHGNVDAFASKITFDGSVAWLRTVGGSDIEKGYSVDQSTDGGYILAGSTASNDGNIFGNHGSYDYMVSKLNASGIIQWTKVFGGTGNDNAYGVQATADNGCIIVGSSSSTDGDVGGNQGSYDGWVVKLDSSGAIVWQKCYGGTGQEELFDIGATADNGYILAGYSFGNDGYVTGVHGSDDYWILKIDGSGNVQWSKLFGGTFIEEAYSIQQTSDGGYVAMGFSNSNDGNVSGHHGAVDSTTDYWVLRLDPNGNMVWQKSLGGVGSDFGYGISQTSDNGFIVSGSSNSTDGDVAGNHGGFDIWVVRINSSGGVVLNNSLGGSGDDGAVSSLIQQTIDGGYALAGNTGSINGNVTGNNGPSDAWVIKLSGGECPADVDGDGYTSAQGDCNENNAAIHPGAADLCNSIDDNCNSVVDENAITATITPAVTVTVCSGTSVTLIANSGSGISYQWKKGNNNITGATNSTYTTTKAASYKVVESNSFGCSSTSSATTIVVNSLPAAVITSPNGTDLCVTGSVLLQANAGASLSYQWMKGSNNISNATSQSYTATKTATYKVTVTNIAGCTKKSGGVKVTKACKVTEAPEGQYTEDINQIGAAKLSLFPNPTDGSFTLELKTDEVKGDGSLQVFNSIGSVILSEPISIVDGFVSKQIILDHSLPDGIYMVRALINTKSYSNLIVLQK